jgi:cyclase
MLEKRVIPLLLLNEDQHLVKTTRFSHPTYVGDPRNAAHIFSTFQADEIVLLDITASCHGREPSYELIRDIASFSASPLVYGGGISRLSHIEDILALGVERVALGSVLSSNSNFLTEAIRAFGSSSITVTINKYLCINGSYYGSFGRSERASGLCLLSAMLQDVVDSGTGEILLIDAERDGTRIGFDLSLYRKMSTQSTVPLIACGGGSTPTDLHNLFAHTMVSGAALGSSFVYRPESSQVLLNYFR